MHRHERSYYAYLIDGYLGSPVGRGEVEAFEDAKAGLIASYENSIQLVQSMSREEFAAEKRADFPNYVKSRREA